MFAHLILRLTKAQAVDLYITLLDLVHQTDPRMVRVETLEILAVLAARLADFEMDEYIRRYGKIPCFKCQQEFRLKQQLVRHTQECFGTDLPEALKIVHNNFRPALILEGRR